MLSLGQKLRQIRKSSRLTLKEFAENLGITDAGLSKIERNKSIPRWDTMVKVAIETGVSLDWFAGIKSEVDMSDAIERVRAARLMLADAESQLNICFKGKQSA